MYNITLKIFKTAAITCEKELIELQEYKYRT